MATFSLRCIICSKDHGYSDISHLLTHVSSKAHLAAYFNATVRGPQDPVLAQRLQQYDQWYKENDIAALLADRMAKKHQKKAAARTASTNIGRPGGKQVKDEPTTAAVPLSNINQSSTINDPAIDPSIQIKSEHDVESSSYFNTTHNSTQDIGPYDDTDQNTSLVPNVGYYSYGKATNMTGHNVAPDQNKNRHVWNSVLNSHQNETPNRSPWELSSPFRPHNNSLFPGSGMHSYGEYDIEDDNGSVPSGKGGGTKLKGVIWPGMALFDAASPDGKRMRNQRKKHEVMSALEKSSGQIKPTEFVYYANTWDFKEDRIINGEVQSPPPSWMPSPKKRQRRRALSEQSTNKPLRRTVRAKGNGHGISKSIKHEQQGEEESRILNYLPESLSPYQWTYPMSGDISRATRELPSSFNAYRDEYSGGSTREEQSFYNPIPHNTSSQMRHPVNAQVGSESEYRQQRSYPQLQPSAARPYELVPYGLSLQAKQDKDFMKHHSVDIMEPQPFVHQERLARFRDIDYHRLSIPPLGTFGHPRSILNTQAPSSQLAQSLSMPVASQFREDDRRIDGQEGLTKSFKRQFSALTTPTTIGKEAVQVPFGNGRPQEESSGDETIDQGIDSSPIIHSSHSLSIKGGRF